ncbi:MAG TPA: magnesium-translocating P-type ATPase [Vicinamibacterales bacterium]|nr:magnesium-translocating P-type ATPase [Vicinamibacterales bacterium]
MLGLMVAPFWSAPIETVLADLVARPDGLTQIEADQRRLRFGPNRSSDLKKVTPFGLLLNQFRSPLVILLLFAMMLSLFLGETTDGVIVLAIVLGSALLGFWQEYRAGNAVARLLAVIQTTVTTLRDGREVDLPHDALVPGDVIVLAAGAAVPADCRILRSTDLFVDESTLTGESYPTEKDAGNLPDDTPLAKRVNVLFQGSHVVSGTGRAVVVQTGMKTMFGEIAERLRLRPPETEFEHGLRQFGGLLIQITLLFVIAIFGINVYLHRPVVDSFLFALALAVGLTPELLPAIVSLTLARGAQQMAKSRVIVRRLNSIEDFGTMNVLCCDKTGTLTEGVVRLHAALDADGNANDQVLLYAELNAAFESGFPNPIDEALRRLPCPDLAAYAKVDEVPYDFIRKRLSVVVERTTPAKDNYRHTMITKGALRNVLEVCVDAKPLMDPGAAGTVPIAEVLAPLQERFETYSEQGYRVLGVAVRDVTDDPIINKDDERQMTFIGFLLLEDPPKAAALDAIVELRQLGVALKIITGDNRLAAGRMGRQMGLERPTVLSGEELRGLSDTALLQRVGEVNIFAEIEPNQKERILAALRKAGNVVGYLGDGINDASALHTADVGISVESAMDVAKEAADIVLLARDLRVLAQGVRLGRQAFANTLKYVFITTSANFGNMVSMAGASVFLPFLPLLPKQILLNNFLSDVPSMTIATDSVDREQVDRPRRWDIRFIRNFMLVFGLVSSVFDYVTFGALLYWLRATEREFQTGWFVESLMTELFIVLVMRTRRPFFRSRPGTLLLATTLIVAGTTIFLPYTAPGALFGFVPLPPSFVLLLLGITGGYLGASELVKGWFFRRFA